MEPFTLINEIHRHKEWGPIFGTYLQPDIIGKKEDFNQILGPKYKLPIDRSIRPGASIIK